MAELHGLLGAILTTNWDDPPRPSDEPILPRKGLQITVLLMKNNQIGNRITLGKLYKMEPKNVWFGRFFFFQRGDFQVPS